MKDHQLKVSPLAVAVLPGIVLLAIFFLIPIANLTARSFTDPVLGLQNYKALFGSQTYLRVGGRTIWLSFLAMSGCIIIGTPVAYAIAHSKRQVLVSVTLAVLVLSFLTSSLIRAFAWMILFGAKGPVVAMLSAAGLGTQTLLATPGAVVIGMIHFLLPIYVLTAVAGLRSMPYELITAAEGLGASRWYALRTVYLPLAFPTIGNAGSLVFVIAVGFFITPALLGGPSEMMLGQLIAISVSKFGDFGFAAATGVVLMLLTLLLLSAVQWLSKPKQKR
ncbi:putative spermidine/putrescine transport system permease protein (plasmid) [Ensifer sp. WSM1721]|uniref:ABC transporter permease n=1 Tax=Ensifer sp. WSM1721 TaxID=1041159 RepID=UPI0006844D08|nr:ABC transporter permease [Ensifer sp. WSM1721]